MLSKMPFYNLAGSFGLASQKAILEGIQTGV
jgi:hypothetical protein